MKKRIITIASAAAILVSGCVLLAMANADNAEQMAQYPNYGMSFYQFTQSTESIDYLTEVFMGAYEGPEISTNHLDKRKEYAAYWNNYFQ